MPESKPSSGLCVLMLCPQFRPLVGGYERAAERLSGELVRQGCVVTVLTDRRSRKWSVEERLNGFTIKRLFCVYRRGVHSLTSLLAHALYLLCHGRRFDVWHVHQYGSHATLAVAMGSLLNRPVVLKLTSSGHQSIEKTLSTGRLAILQAWVHRRVDVCVAVSAETATEAGRFGIPAERIALIGNGVDTDLFHPVSAAQRSALRVRLGLKDRPTALFVGRLVAVKNLLGLLDAWALAYPRFREPWSLVLVGDGPLRNVVEQGIRARELDQSVHLAGPSDRVQEWMQAADLFVLSSHLEGLSNTTLEAMACGLPCVVTEVSGMRGMIGDNGAGFVVPAGDMVAFADALAGLNEDATLRVEMGAKAREVIVDKYSIQTVAAGHAELYRRLTKCHA